MLTAFWFNVYSPCTTNICIAYKHGNCQSDFLSTRRYNICVPLGERNVHQYPQVTAKDCTYLKSTRFNIFRCKPSDLSSLIFISILVATPDLQTSLKITKLKKGAREGNKNQSKQMVDRCCLFSLLLQPMLMDPHPFHKLTSKLPRAAVKTIRGSQMFWPSNFVTGWDLQTIHLLGRDVHCQWVKFSVVNGQIPLNLIELHH